MERSPPNFPFRRLADILDFFHRHDVIAARQGHSRKAMEVQLYAIHKVFKYPNLAVPHLGPGLEGAYALHPTINLQ